MAYTLAELVADIRAQGAAAHTVAHAPPDLVGSVLDISAPSRHGAVVVVLPITTTNIGTGRQRKRIDAGHELTVEAAWQLPSAPADAEAAHTDALAFLDALREAYTGSSNPWAAPRRCQLVAHRIDLADGWLTIALDLELYLPITTGLAA